MTWLMLSLLGSKAWEVVWRDGGESRARGDLDRERAFLWRLLLLLTKSSSSDEGERRRGRGERTFFFLVTRSYSTPEGGLTTLVRVSCLGLSLCIG